MTVEQRAAELLSLQGRVAMITGGASGIGRGIALRLAELGASIVVLDINGSSAAEVARQVQAFGGKAAAIECDVRSRESCHAATAQAIEEFGRIDVLCNNAGIVIRKDASALGEEEWDLVVDVTLKGVYLLSHEVVPQMIRGGGGSIINTGSGWSLKGGPQAAAYCAAKGGVLNLTRAMAIDYGRHNIRVNCVCPGDIDTPMLRSECAQLGQDPVEFFREAAQRPLARVGTPDDVANAVLFLASDMASWITGAHIVVDGGGLA